MGWKEAGAKRLFNDSAGFYNYAPSSILENGVEYHFYCSNRDAYAIVDYIALTKTRHSEGAILAGKQLVLGPTAGSWDAQHTCDPDVLKGAFLYDGETYTWAMFYLGEDFEPNCCMRNQIGVAFAKSLDGPWIKWRGNPIIPFESPNYWGVGQSTSINLDHQGRILLFYSRGDQYGTRTVKRELDLSDMSSPSIGIETPVTAQGLRSRDGSPTLLHNSDLVFDMARGKCYCIAPRYPFDPSTPSFISSELQIAMIDIGLLLSGTGLWEVLDFIAPSRTGKARNHDAGLLRDGYGELPEADQLTANFCGSDTGNSSLWTYRIHQITGDLRKTSPMNIHEPYQWDEQTVDLYHFDLGLDPTGAVFDAGIPQQNGNIFDFANPSSDVHVDSLPGFGECHRYGASTGTGSRSEFSPNAANAALITNQITLEMWFMPESLSGTQSLFDSLTIRVETVGDILRGSVAFSDQTSCLVQSGAGKIRIGEWHHLAMVWDGASGILGMYLDGEKVGDFQSEGKPGLRAFTGFRVIAGSLNPSLRQTFHGKIDEVRISNIARSYSPGEGISCFNFH